MDQVTPVPDKNGDYSGLAFFESTSAATDHDSGTGFAAEGNIGDVTLISSIYSGEVTSVNAQGDSVTDTDNSDENIVLMRGTSTGVLIAAGDGDFGGSGGIDAGIGRAGTGGASIGDVKVTARLEDSDRVPRRRVRASLLPRAFARVQPVSTLPVRLT